MIRNWLREIKWFIQRGRRGWADCDTWSFNNYLTGIIVGGLKRLKEDHHGCPGDLWDKKAVNDECHKWREILDEMIQGFEAYLAYSDNIFYKRCIFEKEIDLKQIENLREKYKRGMALFAEWFLSLWD